MKEPANHGQAPVSLQVPERLLSENGGWEPGSRRKSRHREAGDFSGSQAGNGVAASKAKPFTHTQSVLDARGRRCAHCYVYFAISSKGALVARVRGEATPSDPKPREQDTWGWTLIWPLAGSWWEPASGSDINAQPAPGREASRGAHTRWQDDCPRVQLSNEQGPAFVSITVCALTQENTHTQTVCAHICTHILAQHAHMCAHMLAYAHTYICTQVPGHVLKVLQVKAPHSKLWADQAVRGWAAVGL